MNKGVLILIAAVCVIVVFAVVLLVASQPMIENPASGYLPFWPDFKGDAKTMIFLVSAENPRYDCYSWDVQWSYGEVRKGDSCFIVDVIVRNDYTTDPLWDDENSPAGLYNNHVKLTAYLYNQQGRVDAVDVTYPINSLHGGHVFKIEPEETRSVELYLATESKDITSYEIYVTYLGPLPEP